MEFITLAAHQKDLSFALSSWETLDLFDYVKSQSDLQFTYNPVSREVTLNKRGWFRFEFKSQLVTNTEEMIWIKFRLNIDGVAHPLEHRCNTGTDQQWSQVLGLNNAVVKIEVFATPNDGAPVISNTGYDVLTITKMI